MRRGSATCPCCGFTTPAVSVRKQLKARRGGAVDAQMFCVVVTKPVHRGVSDSSDDIDRHLYGGK
jgi:putative DNA methylase